MSWHINSLSHFLIPMYKMPINNLKSHTFEHLIKNTLLSDSGKTWHLFKNDEALLIDYHVPVRECSRSPPSLGRVDFDMSPNPMLINHPQHISVQLEPQKQHE